MNAPRTYDSSYPGSMHDRGVDGAYLLREDTDSLLAVLAGELKERKLRADDFEEALKQREAELTEMLAWAYGKLHHFTFNSVEDALELDRIKLFLEHRL